jgi:2-polyprenyl-3-methyl-5-hydroxy-6-metoxy-1,4-benzoquinol methylase
VAPGSSTREAQRAGNCGKRIGILVVAYNAVSTLANVFKRITPQVWENVEEVVVLDDASQDHTYELAVGYKTVQEMSKLSIIKNQKNLGYGGNQKAGYRYFAEKGFDVVVLLHGDGQYAPEILSHMYHPIVTGQADAVFGSRMMKDYGGPLKGGMPLYKYAGNRILTTFENRLLGMDLTEFHSGYRAYSLYALRQVDFSEMTNDFHFDTEIIIKLQHQGFRIREVPIPTYYGSEICYVNGMKYAADVVRAVWRYKSTIHSGKPHPEFKEYLVHYPLKEGKYSSHYYFLQLAGRNQDVLDIGCGEGFMAEKIVAQGNRVVGIDMLPEPKIRQAFDAYVQADLTNGLGPAIEKLHGKKFDRILLMDVLEHLARPEVLLGECRGLLKPQGQILISEPNVANITVRLSLLFGRFEYTDRGILDKTHLRLFTRKSARRLIEAAGFEILRQKTTIMPLELALRITAASPVMKLINLLLKVLTAIMPGLLGYQCIFVARPTQ